MFLDGRPLKQVAHGTTPSSGQFSLDSSRHVVLADNPSGKTVEVSVRREWVRGGASGVTIDGFTMKHAANDSQWRAALRNDGYSNWTLQNNVLSDSRGALVAFAGASNLTIVKNELYRGGQLAVNGSDGSMTLSFNRIHDNNTEGFDPGWEAGGVKTVRMSSLTADNNIVKYNKGNGLWCDLDCTNVTYKYNRVHHNDWSGIFFKVSNGAKIYGNAVFENGWSKTGSYAGAWQAAILVSLSRNTEVYDNTVAWIRSGVSVTRYDRDPKWNDIYGNYVHDNQIFSKDYQSDASYDSGSHLN